MHPSHFPHSRDPHGRCFCACWPPSLPVQSSFRWISWSRSPIIGFSTVCVWERISLCGVITPQERSTSTFTSCISSSSIPFMLPALQHFTKGSLSSAFIQIFLWLHSTVNCKGLHSPPFLATRNLLLGKQFHWVWWNHCSVWMVLSLNKGKGGRWPSFWQAALVVPC